MPPATIINNSGTHARVLTANFQLNGHVRKQNNQYRDQIYRILYVRNPSRTTKIMARVVLNGIELLAWLFFFMKVQ